MTTTKPNWRRSLRFYCDLLGFRYVHELEFEGEPSATLLELDGVRFRALYLEREGVVIEDTPEGPRWRRS